MWTKRFPNSQNSFTKPLNGHIFKFLQKHQLSMLFKSTRLSGCNTVVYFHTIWIFCVLPRYLVPSLWRKENVIYDCVSTCTTLMLPIQLFWQANPHAFNNYPLKPRICSIPWWWTTQHFQNLCPPALTLESRCKISSMSSPSLIIESGNALGWKGP